MPDFTVKTDIDNFLQSDDKEAGRDNLGINLDSVTAAGATTLNNISVGRIATLHPTVAANNNTANGNSSASIGGTANVAEGPRSGTFGGRGNEANGTESSTFGGTFQTVRGNESEGFGGTNITLNTKFTNTVGGANHVVGLATSAASDSVAKHSITVGGEDSVIENATHSAIVGGFTNTIETDHNFSVILGGQNITTDAADTAYVDNLDVQGTVYIKQRAAADVNKAGKCQLWVENTTGDLYLTLDDGTSKQIAFV